MKIEEIQKDRRDAVTDLSNKEDQRKIQKNKINETEKRRNLADFVDMDKYEAKLSDLKSALDKIESEIKTIKDKISKLDKQLEEMGSSYDEQDYGYSAKDSSDNSFEEGENFSKSNDDSNISEENIEEKELSIPGYILNFKNPKKRFYSPLSEEYKRISEKTKSSHDNNIPKNKIKASQLLKTNDPIKRTILYVATFFQKLSNKEFNRLVLFLLAGKSITVTIPVDSNSKDEGSVTTISQNKDCCEIWKEEISKNSAKIMNECYLKSVYVDNSFRAIEFDPPYLRQELKTYFEEQESLYLEEQFRCAKFLLLDQSIKIVQNAVELSISMAKSDPISHGRQWLEDILDLFRLFINLLEIKSIFELNLSQLIQGFFPEKEDREEVEIFVGFIGTIDKNQRGDFLISHVAFLIQRMLDYPSLKPCIERFISREIETDNANSVLALTIYLQSVPEFDWLRWSKELLNQKNKSISFYTRELFFFQLDQSKDNLYEIFTEVKSWIPHKDIEKQGDYSQAEVYALRLIYKYSRELSDRLEPDRYGKYPSKYQLFSSLDINKSNDSKLRLLIEWALDSGHGYFVRKPLESASLLFADWFTILCGLDSKNYNPNALELADCLLQQIVVVTNLQQRRELIQYWNKFAKALLSKANNAQRTSKRSLAKSLMQRRQSVMKLISCFRTLQKNNQK